MIQRIPKINVPAMVAMCAAFAMSAWLVHLFGPARVRPFCGMEVMPTRSSSVPVPKGWVRYQADAPLAFATIEFDPKTHTESVTVKNISGRPISAYCLVGGYGDHNGTISESSFSSELSHPFLIDVNASRVWYQNLDRVNEIWVDFVEFSDGTIWGPNTQRTLESMNAGRIGARQAAQKYSWVLRTRGPQAMLASIPEPVTNTMIDGYDERWRSSFNSAVEMVCSRLLQDKANVEIRMNLRSGEAYNAALTERFKQTLESYINFRR